MKKQKTSKKSTKLENLSITQIHVVRQYIPDLKINMKSFPD